MANGEYPEDRPLSVGVVAKILKISKKIVLNYIYKKKLLAYPLLGGHYRVWPQHLADFIRNNGLPVEFVIKRSLFSVAAKSLPRLVVVGNCGQTTADKILSALRQVFSSVDIKVAGSNLETIFLVGSLRPHLLIWYINDSKDHDRDYAVLSLLQSRRLEGSFKIITLVNTPKVLANTLPQWQKMSDLVIPIEKNKEEITGLVKNLLT